MVSEHCYVDNCCILSYALRTRCNIVRQYVVGELCDKKLPYSVRRYTHVLWLTTRRYCLRQSLLRRLMANIIIPLIELSEFTFLFVFLHSEDETTIFY